MGASVPGITPSLDPVSRVSGNAERLAANTGISFEGSKLDGIGFTMEPERARELIHKNPQYAEVLFPYLNGHDLNSHPDSSASRWVIDFHDWDESRAKEYPQCYDQVLRLVKPERQRHSELRARVHWWRYQRSRPELQAAISGLDHVIVITQSSSTQKPTIVSVRQVFAHKLVVFASDETGLLALLSSNVHYWWIERRGSTLKRRLDLHAV